MKKQLGKIKSVAFGFGGYNDGMIGLSFIFTYGEEYIVRDFWGAWPHNERINYLGSVCVRISGLLKDAKVTDINMLKNTPVEITFEANELQSWRVLTEVL